MKLNFGITLATSSTIEITSATPAGRIIAGCFCILTVSGPAGWEWQAIDPRRFEANKKVIATEEETTALQFWR